MALPSTDRWTLESWAARADDARGELVAGRIEDEEMPTHLHEAVVAWVLTLFWSWVRPRGGWAFGSEAKLAVGEARGRKPDVTVYFPGSPRPRGEESVSRAVPDAVVEVVSARPRDARRDRLEKLEDYAAAGVRFYWLIDPTLRTVEVFELQAGRYARALGAGVGTWEAPGCPGLVLDVDALWAVVDELASNEP